MEGPYYLCFLLLGAELEYLWKPIIVGRAGKDTLGTAQTIVLVQFSMFFSFVHAGIL
jgi:hypothetical protein